MGYKLRRLRSGVEVWKTGGVDVWRWAGRLGRREGPTQDETAQQKEGKDEGKSRWKPQRLIHERGMLSDERGG